jgi:peptidoglycan hydrolase CwlO-like protein
MGKTLDQRLSSLKKFKDLIIFSLLFITIIALATLSIVYFVKYRKIYTQTESLRKDYEKIKVYKDTLQLENVRLEAKAKEIRKKLGESDKHIDRLLKLNESLEKKVGKISVVRRENLTDSSQLIKELNSHRNYKFLTDTIQ